MRDKRIWVFNSGMSFDGNPKWLFLYIIKHRPEITCYWFCYTKESVKYIRKLGYQAYLFDSSQAEKIGTQAGVFVVNQRKEVFQKYFKGITVLNLWHGVGCKVIEERLSSGVLDERVAKKYIQNLSVYRSNELFLVTSPLMEKHFIEHCSLSEKQIVRAGYPCCFNNEPVSTYDHDILKKKHLPNNVKIAVYTPTFRKSSLTSFFADAIPQIEELADCLKRNNMVLIFKMHPMMKDDFHYQNAKRMYEDCPQFIFWDNANDIYEIFDQIDLAIIDYSSIFYDMLARGVKHFIRYIFEYGNNENLTDFALDYMEMTCGPICKDFNSLLKAISNYQKIDLESELSRIKKLFWQYADEYTLNDIVENAILFQTDEESDLPTLYSFDIFDTLIARSTLLPVGVFWYVQERVNESSVYFPQYFHRNYIKIRPWCEGDAREYYKKSQLYRDSDKLEISFDMIFDHMKNVYQLTDEQTKLLKEWELEAEYRTSLPIENNIAMLKELVDNGEKVVLISDMYLPAEFIKKLLEKADPILAEIPLFLSSECGYQKTTKRLFLEVYHSIAYNFGQWIHYGDNQNADINIPKKLGITTKKISTKKFNKFENTLIDFIKTYDGYQIGRMMLYARTIPGAFSGIENYAFRQVSFYFVPYINWVIHHALKQKIECLYFIARDGYHLKRIADVIIAEKNYDIKTKYIYGSRKTWRISSYIDSIDEEMWSEFGNFSDVTSYNHLLEASALTDEKFDEFFPSLTYLKQEETISDDTMTMIRDIFRSSQEYHLYLLDVAKRKRVLVEKYLQQEIDFNEKYAFVEFWARGYMQSCLARLLWDIEGKESDNIFYYARSIYPTHGKLIRYNFTGNTWSMIFIEAIFANMPYKSVTGYVETENGVEPVLERNEYNAELYLAMERCLPEFAKAYVGLDLRDEDAINRAMFDFGLSYFYRHPNDPIWLKYFACLKDTPGAYGEVMEWAPERKWSDIFKSICGKKFITKNYKWSIRRSSKSIRKAYNFYERHIKGRKAFKKLQKILGKVINR